MSDYKLPPFWSRNASDSLIDLALQLKAWEQGQTGNPTAAVEVWHQVILLSQAEIQVLQPPQSSPVSLFARDYCAWVKEQIRLLHLRQFDQLDLEHLPDELHDLVGLAEREVETNVKCQANSPLNDNYFGFWS